jgi:hypothetical protein
VLFMACCGRMVSTYLLHRHLIVSAFDIHQGFPCQRVAILTLWINNRQGRLDCLEEPTVITAYRPAKVRKVPSAMPWQWTCGAAPVAMPVPQPARRLTMYRWVTGESGLWKRKRASFRKPNAM